MGQQVVAIEKFLSWSGALSTGLSLEITHVTYASASLDTAF
ncbi:MAG TPA: hypothetical protein QF882_02220 [Arenicellales bacterium]|nr:hypothetical protein [Arenicellales bacterium]